MEKSLNRNIKNFRSFKGMTQEELATQIGKSKNVISNWERGDNSPDVECVEKICRALGVTPNQLFGWEPYPAYEDYMKIMEEKKMRLSILEDQRNQIQGEINDLLVTIKTEAMKWLPDNSDNDDEE